MNHDQVDAINELARELWETAESKGWHEKPRSFGDIIALCHSELSEALEAYRETGDVGPRDTSDGGKPEGVGVELADCVIRILEFCHGAGINLGLLLHDKAQYNATRPHRHGGKVL